MSNSSSAAAPTGAFYIGTARQGLNNNGSTTHSALDFDASKSSSIYTTDGNILPNSIVINYIIKA